jgi:glucose-6-phosphate 1-dehydrogenase
MIIGLFDANEESIAYPAAGLPVRRASRESISPRVVVLFGGDLARRKLVPGLYLLSESTLTPERRIVVTSLDDLDDGAFREFARAALREFGS